MTSQRQSEKTTSKVEFQSPVRLLADGEPVRAEEPGYAAPCLADIDQDGVKDLLVGQYNDGKIAVYKGLSDGKFGKRKWLQASGEVAMVPDVW